MDEKVIEIESIPTKIRYKGIIWIPASSIKVNHSKGNVKKSYLIKWIDEKKPGMVFHLDDFFSKYPKHKTDKGCRDRVDKTISGLIHDKRLLQMSSDTFRVIR